MKLFVEQKTSIFIFLITCALLFHVFIRGYNPQDEGWVLYGAWRIFEGEIPYHDFQYLYTPLTAFLGSLSFGLFGVSILSERIMALLIAGFASTILYSLLQNLKISKIISLLLVTLFVVWGPLQTNYLSPSILSVELGIIYLYFVVKSIQNKGKTTLYFFLSGIFVSLTILTKQTFGAAIAAHVIFVVLYLIKSQTAASIKPFVLGILTPLLLFALFLITTSSLDAFIQEMYSFLLLDAIAGGFTYHTPLSYPAPFLYKIAKILLYSSPLIISVLAMMLFVKKKSRLTLVPLLVILFYFVGIQPVIDTIHLTPLIAISSVSLGLLFVSIENKKIQSGIMLGIFLLITLGIYNGVFRNYFKWFAPIYTNNTQLTSSRAKILIHSNDAAVINPTVSYIKENSESTDYFFNYGMTPLLYFLSDRRSPSKFNTIETRNVQGKNLEMLHSELMENPPEVIISDGEFRNINPTIESFVRENYVQIATVSGRPVFKSRNF